MSVLGSFAQRFSRPAGKVLDAPIRDIVQAVLKEHGYASPAEVQALRDELRDLRGRVDALDKKVTAAGATADQARAGATAASRAAEAAGASAAAASTHAEAAQKTASAEPRAAALQAKIAELEAALQALSQADPRIAELEGGLAMAQARVGELEGGIATAYAQVGELETGLAAAHARIAELESRVHEATAPPPATEVVDGAGCKVAGCPEPVRSKGFCSAHYQQWRRGTLKGFVTAEATALIDGKTVHLPKETAGATLTIQNGKIYADGRLVKAG